MQNTNPFVVRAYNPRTMPEQREDREKWVLASTFADSESAGRAYKKIRNAILGTQVDATSYNVQIKGVPYVVMLGDGSLPELLHKVFKEACVEGKEKEVPQEVREALEERRAAGRLPGAFWEAHHQPGLIAPTRRERRRRT